MFLLLSCAMKTLQKQWLEALGTYQYILTFLFTDGRSGRGMGAWGPKGEETFWKERLQLHLPGCQSAKGRGKGQMWSWELAGGYNPQAEERNHGWNDWSFKS